jgi:hypothetical protein
MHTFAAATSHMLMHAHKPTHAYIHTCMHACMHAYIRSGHLVHGTEPFDGASVLQPRLHHFQSFESDKASGHCLIHLSYIR